MPKINSTKTCTNFDHGCGIHRTKLIQNGNGDNYVCPICGAEYWFNKPPPKKVSAEEIQEYLDTMFDTCSSA